MKRALSWITPFTLRIPFGGLFVPEYHDMFLG